MLVLRYFIDCVVYMIFRFKRYIQFAIGNECIDVLIFIYDLYIYSIIIYRIEKWQLVHWVYISNVGTLIFG